MKLVIGLGNPGGKYEKTRHNVGFRVVDELARRWAYERSRERFNGQMSDGHIRDVRTLLLKPATYMNLSGRCVREAAGFLKLDCADLLVVVDDMALPVGRLRVRSSGSAGGHNGLSSIIRELGSDEFSRLRIGIGQVAGARMVGHVLGAFTPEEEAVVANMVSLAADAVECWVVEGTEAAMNRFNRTDEAEPPAAG